MLTLAGPVVATMMSYTLAQFVDGMMVSRLGDGALAAQGNGGVIAFIPIAVMMGLFGVINTFVSQNFGAGRERQAAAYPWNGLWLGFFVWLIVLVPFALALRPITEFLATLVGKEESAAGSFVIENQIRYAQILLYGAIFTLNARALHQFFFGMHKPWTVLISTVAGNSVNLVANYALIFGKFGMPELGVPGAAIGTVIGTAVEFAIPLAVFMGPKLHAQYGTRAAWRLSMPRVKDITRVGAPAGMMYGNEMICWALMMAWLIGSISVADNDAAWIGLRYMHISFMPAVGMSVAVTAIVGRYIGMNRYDLAISRAWLGLRVTMVYMGICAAIFVFFRRPLVGAFISDDHSLETAAEILRIGSLIMICAAVFQLFDAVGIIMIGALRGAGDTLVPGIVTAVFCWVFIILGGLAMKEVYPELGALGPWIAAAGYIIALAIFTIARFMSGKWKKISLLGEELPDLHARDVVDAGLVAEIAAAGVAKPDDFVDG